SRRTVRRRRGAAPAGRLLATSLRPPDARQLFHRSDNRGEVFITVRGELPGVLRGGHLHGRSRRRYRDRQLHGRRQNQSEVLEHQAQRERGWVLVVASVLELGLLTGRDHRGFTQDLQE